MRFLADSPLSIQRLIRVGGAGDKGVDLRGWWQPRAGQGPSTPREKKPLAWPVVVQCKAERRRLGPGIVRELEGAVGYEVPSTGTMQERGQLTKPTSTPTIAVLVGLSGFSDEAHRRAVASRVPIVLVHLPFAGLTEQALRQLPGHGACAHSPDHSLEEKAISISFNPALKELLDSEDVAVTVGLRRRFAEQPAEADVTWAG